MLTRSDLVRIALFAALVLTSSLQGLAASGHFPRRPQAPVRASSGGPIILFGSMALGFVGFVVGTAAALHLIAWYAAIIGGGSAILAAPLVLQWFPDGFVDGNGALIVFAAASIALAVLLIGVPISAQVSKLY